MTDKVCNCNAELQQGPNQRVSDFKYFIDQKFIKAYGINASQSGDNEMKQIREYIKKKILLKGLTTVPRKKGGGFSKK